MSDFQLLKLSAFTGPVADGHAMAPEAERWSQ